MQKFLFVLALTATLAMINPAKAQGYWVFPGYVFPGYIFPGYVGPRYVFPRYVFPGYVAPDYAAPDYVVPGYQDWRQHEYYEQLRGPVGITTDTRNVGECAIGMSEETCRRRGQRYNPPRQN